MNGNVQILPESPQLDLPKFQWWYDAIINDRLDVIKHHLRTSSTDYKNQLVNGRFSQRTIDSYGLNDKEGKFGYESFQVFLPFNLAIAYCASRETISEFLSHGVDVTLRDHHGNNCIHVMVTMAFLKPGAEDYMKDLYGMISDYLPRTKLKSILLQEDNCGFRPLELAANNGTFGLFLDIFHTRGVYLTRECTRGIYLKQYFDITEYESMTGSRRHRSPLTCLGLLDMDAVDRKYTEEMFKGQHVHQWIKFKYKKNLIFFILWFLSRMMLATGFIVFDNTFIPIEERINDPNLSNMTCLQRTTSMIFEDKAVVALLAYYLILHSFLGLVFDIWDIVNAHRHDISKNGVTFFKTIKGSKRLVVDYWTYRVSQSCINLGILLNVVVRMFRYEYEFGVSVLSTSFMHLIILANIAASFVFFLQLVPIIGFYAVVIQRMSSMFMNYFFILYLTVAIPFMLSFDRIVNFGKMDCEENFSSVWQGLYSTFLLTFNMIDFQDIESPSEQTAALYFIHVAFVLLIGVLLVNFLIALFTYHVGFVLQSSNIIIPVQCTFLMWLGEERIQRILKKVLFRLEKKYFTTDSDGKLYISQVLVADKGDKKVEVTRSTSVLREHPLMRKLSDISDTDETFL